MTIGRLAVLGLTRVARWVTPKRLLVVGLVLIAVVLLNAGLRTFSKSSSEFCGDLRHGRDIAGIYETENTSTLPEMRRTAFPFGTECSYFTGVNKARIDIFDDYGTAPMLVGFSFLAAAPVLAAIRRATSDRDRSSA
jgi:hypothetical protein